MNLEYRTHAGSTEDDIANENVSATGETFTGRERRTVKVLTHTHVFFPERISN